MNKYVCLAAIGAAFVVAAPAMAQTDASRAPLFTGYATLGYSNIQDLKVFDGVTGRLGLRYGKFIGAEAEGAFGVGHHTVPNDYRAKFDRTVAAYAVGYVPLTSRFDLFARAGVGDNKINIETATNEAHFQRGTWNYGGGAQYFLTAHDGLRADYTRESYRGGPGHADVYGLSYVRKF